MSQSILDPTPINVYGINAFINKFEDTKADSKIEVLNLENIKENFKVDFEFDDNINQIEETELPAFTQLTYNKRVLEGKSSDSSYSTSYNRPPLGPIDNFCYCSYCDNVSPEYHAMECPYPEKKSLFLTMQGIYQYIIQNTKDTFSENINNFKQKWLNNSLTQVDLNNFLLVPNSIIMPINGASNEIPLTNARTKIQYFDVVKLRGPTKLEFTTATQKFSNAIMLSYEFSSRKNENNENDEITKKTSIRIYRNGLINLINIPHMSDTREILYKTLIDRINQYSDDNVNLENFNRLTSEYTEEEFDEYAIIPNTTYIHSVNSQFNMWAIKNKYILYFKKLNDLISPIDSSGRIVSGQYTNIDIIPNINKQIMKLIYKDASVTIVNWEYVLAKETRNQSMSREEIKCIILPKDGIKISLQIHKHGTFQMSMSYCNPVDIKNGICTKIIKKENNPLDFSYFDIVRYIFIGILSEKPYLYGESLDYSQEETGIIRNTVSGNSPPNKPGTSTAVCRAKDPRPGYPGLRPIPYSFKGQCQESRQILDPMGVLGSDGLYYPCCSSKTKQSEENYKEYLKTGFPKNMAEAKEYGLQCIKNEVTDTLVCNNDLKSGILVPGSLNIGASARANINGVMTPVKVLGYKGKSKKPQEIFVQNMNTGQQLTINRSDFERDSRYMPGLQSLSKEQLLLCITKHFKARQNQENVVNATNLVEIKDKISVLPSTFNPIMSVLDIGIFKTKNYFVTSVPNTSNLYYLYITPAQSYYINQYGTKKPANLSEPINENIILLGFLEETSNKYFITDILYFNSVVTVSFKTKINMLKEMEEAFFITENTIVFPEYESNIIRHSKELLQELRDIILVFTPDTDYEKLKIWTPITPKQEIILQIIKKVKTNYFILGYENEPINNFNISFSNIFIQKAFIDLNNIKINDYILFKFDYNLKTSELSSRILTPIEKTVRPKLSYNETLIKLSLILNPIKESFFMNNRLDDDFIWNIPGRDEILKFESDALPLINYV